MRSACSRSRPAVSWSTDSVSVRRWSVRCRWRARGAWLGVAAPRRAGRPGPTTSGAGISELPYVSGEFTKSSFPGLLIHNAGLIKIFRGGQRPLGGQLGGAAAVHPVEHQPGERHVLRGQPLHEVRGLAQRVPLRARPPPGTPCRAPGAAGTWRPRGCGSRRTWCPSRPRTSVRPCSSWPPSSLPSVPVIIDMPDVQELHPGPAAHLRRGHQQPDEPAVQEGTEPLRRVQEVQRGAATAGCRR